jgi:hypothetical protein
MGNEKCVKNFGRKNLKVRDHSEYLGVDGRIILEWILREIGWEAGGQDACGLWGGLL